MSEPHQASQPASKAHILHLLEQGTPYAIGEVQRLAIGFRLATMETDAATVSRRLRKFLENTPEEN